MEDQNQQADTSKNYAIVVFGWQSTGYKEVQEIMMKKKIYMKAQG